MYELRPPVAPLRPFIEHYWFVQAADGPVNLCVNVFVDGRADLVFNYGAPYQRTVIGGPTVEHLRSNLDAQRLVPIRILQRGLVHIVGVRFTLGGLGPFARAPLAAFTGLTPEPSAIFGAEAQTLEDALVHEADIDAQARLLDTFFVAHVQTDRPSFRRFDAALRHLVETHGAATVQETAQAAGVSPRHADRLFGTYLGIAPKTVGRVLRFQRGLRWLMRDPGCALAEVAAEAGYFDQAHFVRDFKRMTGGVPRGYRGYFPPDAPTDFAPNVVAFLQDGRPTSEPR